LDFCADGRGARGKATLNHVRNLNRGFMTSIEKGHSRVIFAEKCFANETISKPRRLFFAIQSIRAGRG
jgi:hypothetical protein